MKLVAIYDGTLFECQMIKNLLENEGIESMLKDQIIGAVAGVWNAGGGVKLLVWDEEYEEAIKVVSAFNASRNL